MNYTDDNNDDAFRMQPWEQKFKFQFLLALQVPSFCCSILILRYFKWKQVKSQIYGILIVIDLLIIILELPITQYFVYKGSLRLTDICTSWIVFNYSLFLLNTIMIAWISIERYLFIYHEQLIMHHIMLLHYIPITCIIIYCPVFYIGAVVLYPCQRIYELEVYLCGGACFKFDSILGTIDWLGNDVSMVMITFIINNILIVRYLIQRHRMKRAAITMCRRRRWRRSIKLIVQLLSVVVIYMIARLPSATLFIIQIFRNSTQLEDTLSQFFVYLPYLQALLLPYLCVLFIPEIKRKLRTLFTVLSCKNIIHRQNRIQHINNRQM